MSREPLLWVDGARPSKGAPVPSAGITRLLSCSPGKPIMPAWLEALPEMLHGTATAEALQAIVDLDLETLASIELPRSYGRD
jgi:hypothetical protein